MGTAMAASVGGLDYYALLGLGDAATGDEIRVAYRDCCKRHHPDRLGAGADPRSVAAATTYMVLLNQAYETLADQAGRREYDAARRHGARRPEPARPAATATPRASGTSGAGSADAPGTGGPQQRTEARPAGPAPTPSGNCPFADLPPFARDRLLKLRNAARSEAYRIHEDGWGGTAAMLAVLLAAVATPAVMMPGSIAIKPDAWQSLAGAAAVLGGLAGGCAARLVRLVRCEVGTCEFFSPYYHVAVEGDSVRWHRLADLSAVRSTEHHTNGSYTGTVIELDFAGSAVRMVIDDRESVAHLLKLLRGWQAEALRAHATGDRDYMLRHAFLADAPARPRTGRPLGRWLATACCLAAGALAGLGAAAVSKAADQRIRHARLDRHAERRAAEAPAPVATSPAGARPNQYGDYPAETPAGIPPPPWRAPAVPPPPPAPRWDVPPLPLPWTGRGMNYTGRPALAPFEVATRGDTHYFVKLVELGSGRVAVSTFVRAGERVELKVPLGVYEVRYAAGHTWYGEYHLFGPDTRFAKAGEWFDFKATPSGYAGFTIELYLRPNGNLQVNTITADQF